jgi:Sulfotransferase family
VGDMEEMVSQKQDYSLLDRTIHRLAFANRSIQLSAADIERSLYGSSFQGISIDRPVFITSLPRAGTTLLLELFSRVPGVATHRYRDMPFVMAPMLWQELSRHFRKQSILKERAHGDGMQVGYDSPEAFEEVLWHAFWPQKYRPDGILPWSEDDRNEEFRKSLVEHMQKIIALRCAGQTDTGRYVSKNNANIARIGLLMRMFPDAYIVVPFRHPVDHAASMLRQHRNFLARHSKDPFSRKYMHDIGHFEFGQLHRPIRFAQAPDGDTETIEYWLKYWVSAFTHILSHQTQVVLLSFENLCAGGADTFKTLADKVGIGADSNGDGDAPEFRPPPVYRKDIEIHDSRLLEAANELHGQLLQTGIL